MPIYNVDISHPTDPGERREETFQVYVTIWTTIRRKGKTSTLSTMLERKES